MSKETAFKTDPNTWRDQQLKNFAGVGADVILEQEQVMLDFVSQYPDVRWKWMGDHSSFYNICNQHISITDNEHTGIILFNSGLFGKSSGELVEYIRDQTKNVDYAYVGINRYTILGGHDIDIPLPDDIGESIDCIMHYCDPKFKRLYRFNDVDGNHMVAVHPMDCYGLCR